MYPSPTKGVIELVLPTYKALKKIIPGWEWVPERGEFAIRKQPSTLKPYLIEYEGFFEGCIETCNYGLVAKDNIIPILDWERIEEILEGVGYELEFRTGHRVDGKKGDKNYLCWLNIGKKVYATEFGETRQLAVMRAVVRLGKEVR